jgi:hypothetical protein
VCPERARRDRRCALPVSFSVVPLPIVFTIAFASQHTLSMTLIICPATLVYLLFRCAASFSHHCSPVAMPAAFDPVTPIRATGWSNQFPEALTEVVRPATDVLRTVRHSLFTLAVSFTSVPGSLDRSQSAATIKLTLAISMGTDAVPHRVRGAVAKHRSAFSVRGVICPVTIVLMHSLAPNVHTNAMAMPSPPVACT